MSSPVAAPWAAVSPPAIICKRGLPAVVGPPACASLLTHTRAKPE